MRIVTWLMCVLVGATFLGGVVRGAERQMTPGNKELPVVHVQSPTEEQRKLVQERNERDQALMNAQPAYTPVR